MPRARWCATRELRSVVCSPPRRWPSPAPISHTGELPRMYRGVRVGVSIPAYNEEKLIGKTVATMPDFVDCIVITNDGSKDRTLEVLTELADNDKRVVVLDNDRNRGVGYTVIRGLKENVEQGMDLIAVMAADAQCDPTFL